MMATARSRSPRTDRPGSSVSALMLQASHFVVPETPISSFLIELNTGRSLQSITR